MCTHLRKESSPKLLVLPLIEPLYDFIRMWWDVTFVHDGGFMYKKVVLICYAMEKLFSLKNSRPADFLQGYGSIDEVKVDFDCLWQS